MRKGGFPFFLFLLSMLIQTRNTMPLLLWPILTEPYFTTFEITAIIAERANQLQENAASTIRDIDVEMIAQEEFHKNLIEGTIRRPLPNGLFERVSIQSTSWGLTMKTTTPRVRLR